MELTSLVFLALGVVLGTFAVVMSVVFQTMENKCRTAPRDIQRWRKVNNVRAIGVTALYSSALLILLGLVLLVISTRI